MRRSALLLAAFGVLLPAPVRADRLTNARAQPMAEVSHDVRVTIEDGVARYRVRRTFANSGTQSEEASLRIDLAHGAAVTGLRIRARDRWYDGELMEAEEARAKYHELTGIGAWVPKDPALLQWVWADEAHLQIFPVLPGSVSTVEYTLTAPLEYRQGRYVLSYPQPDLPGTGRGLSLTAPVLRVDPGHGDARTLVRVAGQRVAPDTPVVILAPPPAQWVGEGEPDPHSGHVLSQLAIAQDEPVTVADVDLEIDHTFSGDLQVHLVTPAGKHLDVTTGSGGSNDIRGTFKVELPEGTRSAGDWHLVVSDHAGLDVGTLDAWALALTPSRAGAAKIRGAASDLPRFIPDAPDGDGAGGQALIEVEPPRISTLDARLGRVVASAEHGFSRVEIDAAPRLRELPRRASVVFVLDVSRSVAEEDVEAQLRIARGYLSHVPDASVELVAFDRRARRVFGGFVAAREFEAALARAREAGGLARANGSALELGLGAAAAALKERRGPTRVVALTDALVRTRFRNALADAALAAAPAGTVTHVVVQEPGPVAALTRDDAHALAPIADGHRGVLFVASAPEDDKSLGKVVLGLVRPVGIDHFKVGGVDLASAREVPETLLEGTGYRAMIGTPDPAREIVLTGKIWAANFRRVVRHEAGFDAATAAFVFSEDEFEDLSKAEMLKVAFAGRAVSPVTSYLAVEPGVRPSVDGLEREDALGVGGAGLVGFGGGGGGSGTVARDLWALLAAEVTRCQATQRPPAGWRVGLRVETTLHEVADVEVTRATHAGMGACVEAAAWSLELPEGGWKERATHETELR